MRVAPRSFLAVALLFWLMSVPPLGGLARAGVAHPSARGHGGNGHVKGQSDNGDDQGDDEGDGDGGGGSCGSDPNDADQLASVRATAAAQCDCASARSHGSYVSCVRQAVDAAVGSGSLRAACRDDVTKCASKSTCGREGSVTCCRTDKH